MLPEVIGKRNFWTKLYSGTFSLNLFKIKVSFYSLSKSLFPNTAMYQNYFRNLKYRFPKLYPLGIREWTLGICF